MRFYLDGEMPPYLLAKDIILQVDLSVHPHFMLTHIEEDSADKSILDAVHQFVS